MAKNNGAAAYFRAHVYDDTAECMIWPYGTVGQYGRVRLGRLQFVVSILACQAHNGPRPGPAMEAAHGPCHNPRCWNGRHLSWKTHAENHADRERDGTSAVGEGNPRARLTASDVLAIRARYATGAVTQEDLAREYQISRTVISHVVNRKRWAHV